MTTPTSFRTSIIRGRTARITKVDSCGNPVAGSANQLVVTGFITVKMTKNMDGGTEIKVPQADDTIAVYKRGRQTLLDFAVEIDWAIADTGGQVMMSADAAVLDWQAAVSGWEEIALQQASANWALELWTGTTAGCVGSSSRFGYFVLPFLENAYTDMDDVTNSNSNFKIMANTTGPNAWGKGPYTVVASDSSNTPSRLLQPMSTKAHRHFELTTIAPPSVPANAGPQSLTLPSPY